MKNFSKAAENFEKALPVGQEKVSWHQETLYHLGWSYLNIADTPDIDEVSQLIYFEKAESAFNALLRDSSEERFFLALGQCYLTKANRLKNEQTYQQADQLLARQDIFLSREAKLTPSCFELRQLPLILHATCFIAI